MTERQDGQAGRAPALIEFICNICSVSNRCDKSLLAREQSSCVACGSSVRMRSMVHLLSIELFGESLPIAEFPLRADVIGFGLSDWNVYATQLSKKLNYVNTFYHTAPFLDITRIPDSLNGVADFLIATDVFEHVLPPVSLAFEGARKLLRADGFFVFSVPYGNTAADAIEHFPDIADFSVRKGADGVYRMHNRTRDGVDQVHENLVFHGGPGSTLEMRVFAREELERHFLDAGFSQVRFESEDEPRWGIDWSSCACSYPIVARA